MTGASALTSKGTCRNTDSTTHVLEGTSQAEQPDVFQTAASIIKLRGNTQVCCLLRQCLPACAAMALYRALMVCWGSPVDSRASLLSPSWARLSEAAPADFDDNINSKISAESLHTWLSC